MSALLALVFVVGPGLFVFLRGRALLAHADDPALPERYFAYRRQMGSAVATGLALLMVLAWDQAAWAMPLMLLGTAAGGFRLRRALFDESWGIVSYLAHVIRFTAATSGLWILVALAPSLVVTAEGWRRLAALVLAAVLLAWSLAYNAVFVRLLGARALARPDLDERFTAIEARAHVIPPRRLAAGPTGGCWANAFALPSSKQGAVVFGHTLLELLEPDEIGAVHAHELAHLEHFDKPRLRRGFAVTLAAIALACGLVPLAALRVGDWRTVVLWAWPVTIMIGISLYMSRHKAHEGESDARAVALLGGQGDALIRALTRIHALSALPARWAADFEQTATHPSLAARAQMIRAAAGLDSVSVTEPLLVRGTVAGEHVVLEPERLHLLAGVPASAEGAASARETAVRARTFRYDELTELRVHAGVTGPSRLVVRPKSGRVLKVSIRTEDVPPLQAALDRVGARLAMSDAASRAHPALVTLFLFAVLMGSMALGPAVALAPLLAAAVALAHPAASGLAALAVTAAGAALLVGAPPEGAPMGAQSWVLARWVLLLVGAVAAVLAARTARRTGVPVRWAWIVPAGLGAFSALLLGAWLSAAWLEPAALRLHQAALARPSAALLPLGLAAALLASPSKRLRWVAVLPALLAALPLAARSERFARRYAQDPLHAAAPAFAEHDSVGEPWREVRLDGLALIVRVSPSGSSYARQAPSTDLAPSPAFRFARFSGEGAAGADLDALDLQFLDDSRVLAVRRVGEGRELQLLDVATGEVSWRQPLPALSAPRVALDAPGEWWRVTGMTADPLTWVVVEGPIGGKDVQERRTKVELSGLATPLVVQTSQGALGIRPTTVFGGVVAQIAGLYPDVLGTELWDLGTPAPTRLLDSAFSLGCTAPPPGEPPRYVCAAYDGTVSHLWSLEPPTWQRTPLGTVPGRLNRLAAADGWVVGMGPRGDWLVLDLATRTFDRLPGEPEAVTVDLSLRGDFLAGVSLQQPMRGVLRVYRLTR